MNHDRPVASGGAGGACAPHFLVDQLTLSQPGGGRLCPPNNTGSPGFSDPHTVLAFETKPSVFIKCLHKTVFCVPISFFSLSTEIRPIGANIFQIGDSYNPVAFYG